MIRKKPAPGLDPEWAPVSPLGEAVQADCVPVSRFGGEGRSEKIMLKR